MGIEQSVDLSAAVVNPIERINQATQAKWKRALQTDQFEVAEGALREVSDLKTWREASQRSSFKPFYQLVEAATTLGATNASETERQMVAELFTSKAQTLSPWLRDMYLGLLSKIDGSTHEPGEKFAQVTNSQLADLENSGDLEVLFNRSDVSWETKLNFMKAKLEGRLMARKYWDREEKEKQEQKPKQQREYPATPPTERNQSKPGMDEMQRLKEGEEAPAIWTINPPFGGYYKEQSFDTWDPTTNTWRQSEYKYSEPEVPGDYINKPNKPIYMTAAIPAGKSVRLPVPYIYEYTHLLEGDRYVETFMDQNDDYILSSNSAQESSIKAQFTNLGEHGYAMSGREEPQPISMTSNLTPETEQKLADVDKTRHGCLAKARALAAYTMRRLEYSNDSSFNAIYDSDSDGYTGAIDKFKKADCDVANTYFATLCSRLGIPVRHVVGHMVKGKDAQGNASITSGTGHAWTEVWDDQKGTWVRLDATPPGDPQLEQDEQSESIPGDYGGQEAIGPTDEELKTLEEKLSQKAEALSYTKEEREISEETGIDLKEARQIVKEIQQAESTRLPSGERVVDVMSELWEMVFQSRLRQAPEYKGPLRRREGGERITNIVAHQIGASSGESDPASRERERLRQKVELIVKNWRLILGGDKSGSMSQTFEGEEKWRLQRKVGYVFLSSLHNTAEKFRQAAHRMEKPLDIQSEMMSFRGSAELDIDKPLSPRFTATDKVKLWKSLTNQGGGNGDITLLSELNEQLDIEQQALSQEEQDEILRTVIMFSDGEPDDPAGVRALVEQIGKKHTTVVGIGITETAVKVPVIFNTPFSRGDLIRTEADAIPVTARHIILDLVKLIPEQWQSQYQKRIESILAKFKPVSV